MASQVSDAFGTKERINPDAVWNGSLLPPRPSATSSPQRANRAGAAGRERDSQRCVTRTPGVSGAGFNASRTTAAASARRSPSRLICAEKRGSNAQPSDSSKPGEKPLELSGTFSWYRPR